MPELPASDLPAQAYECLPTRDLAPETPSRPEVSPAGLRTNLLAGDLVEVNRASVNGRAWMSTVAPVTGVLTHGSRAELLSDPTRSENKIWVRVRPLEGGSTDVCYVIARYLDLIEARADAPLTVMRQPGDRETDVGSYEAGDLVYTTVQVKLRESPGVQGAILTELAPNSVGAVRPGAARIGQTDWIAFEVGGRTGWVATKHTRFFTRDGKWIEVTLAAQSLTAWNNGTIDTTLSMSSGKPGFQTPTGVYSITRKLPARRTVATVKGEHWDIPGVPWIMVFREGGYYFHGVYWHNDFGSPVSHGCVTLAVPDAEWLYEWTPVGTPVWIHD